MSNRLNPLQRIREFSLSFPHSTEVIQFGHPFFKWRSKPFAIFSDDTGHQLSIKVEKQSQQVFLQDPRFTFTSYIGRHGWVTLALAPPIDWEEVEELIRGSYLLVSQPPPKAKKKQK